MAKAIIVDGLIEQLWRDGPAPAEAVDVPDDAICGMLWDGSSLSTPKPAAQPAPEPPPAPSVLSVLASKLGITTGDLVQALDEMR